jgi:hypothetical protein
MGDGVIALEEESEWPISKHGTPEDQGTAKRGSQVFSEIAETSLSPGNSLSGVVE